MASQLFWYLPYRLIYICPHQEFADRSSDMSIEKIACWTDEMQIHHVHVTLLAPDLSETPTLNDIIGLSRLRQQVAPLEAPCILTIGPENLIIRIVEGACSLEFTLRIRPFDSLAQACHVIRLADRAASLHDDINDQS